MIYLDDILIIGRDYQEHLHTLSEVLKAAEGWRTEAKKRKVCIHAARGSVFGP